jgi:hypothetical protein
MGFFQFNENTAEFEGLVEAGEPVHRAPVESGVFSGGFEFLAVECATFSGVAGEES